MRVLIAAALMWGAVGVAHGQGFEAGLSAGDAFDRAETYDVPASMLEARPMSRAAIEKEYAEAQRLLEAGEFAKAARKFDTVTDHTISADVWGQLGYALNRSGNAKKAERSFLHALKIDARHVGVNYFFGEFLLEQNRVQEAEQRLAALEACCRLNPATSRLAAAISAAKAGAAIAPTAPQNQ